MRVILALFIAAFLHANALADDAAVIDKSKTSYGVVYRHRPAPVFSGRFL